MKDIRFYLEFESKGRKRLGAHTGNVVAVIPGNVCPDGSYEAIGAVYHSVNSPVASTSVARDYLAETCKRINETEARAIHPNLFAYLDQED